MVRTAPVARHCAAFGVDAEQAFAVALLHDVGKLVIFDRLASLRTARRRDEVSAPAMSSALRLLHEPLGGLCALRWGLGEQAATAISTHHRDPIPAIPNVLSEMLCCAERVDLANVRQVPFDLDALWKNAGFSGDVDVFRDALAASSQLQQQDGR